MELHPVLEGDNNVASYLWYVISAVGDRPSVRVGHTAVYIPGSAEKKGKILFIGGANPSETFSDIHHLDLDTLSWKRTHAHGFVPRYEHACFIPTSLPNQIFVLGGATQEENLMNVQAYNIDSDAWITVETKGPIPSPRTHHSSASIGDCLYLYSGGQAGADPVPDRRVYCFNAVANLWSTLQVAGESPQPRHGHSICAIDNKLYLFGGMSGTKFYNDLYVLDFEGPTWLCPKSCGADIPMPRAGHTAVSFGDVMYVFGGMNAEGVALDDLWSFNSSSLVWTRCKLNGPPPACRLDLASCVIRLPLKRCDNVSAGGEVVQLDRLTVNETTKGCADCEKPSGLEGASSQYTTLMLIHGGMDTQGEIFDDCLIYKLN